jgi:ribosomal protein L37E
MAETRVMKHGGGYDLVVTQIEVRRTRSGEPIFDGRMTLGIRCHTCGRVSYHPKDVEERYCGACHRFHEEHLLDHEA